MELNHLVHTLTYNGVTTTVGEPVGFDNIKVSMKRHEFHGMSAEFSELSLEFYEEAVDVIDAAYSVSLDSVVEYRVAATGGELLYFGVLDLSTYSKKTGEYTTVSCKVGEVGAKTTFNDRTDVDVNINSMLTIDGTLIPTNKRAYQYTLYIPSKRLVFTNRWIQISTKSITKPLVIYWRFGEDAIFQLEKSVVNEFGDVGSGEVGAAIYNVSDINEFRKHFGEGCELTVDGKININFLYKAVLAQGWNTGTPVVGESYSIISASENETKYATFKSGGLWADYSNPQKIYMDVLAWRDDGAFPPVYDTTIRVRMHIFENNTTSKGYVEKVIKPTQYGVDLEEQLQFDLSNIVANAEKIISIGIGTVVDWNIIADGSVSSSSHYYFALNAGSSLRFKMRDTIQQGNTPAVAYSVGDILVHICQCVSELAIDMKSDWYGLPNSPQYAQQIGGGALKFITNGYKIRGVYGGENGRGLPVSFKTMIESLNAQDCIGWGFSTENGTTYVRVERWDWFYKADVLLQINNAKTVTITTDTDRMISELNIGYKKYDTSSEYDSIDSIHSERTFVSGIKAISNDKSALCDFIADNYSIEETRRAAIDVDKSESFKFDENLFVLEAYKPTNANYAVAKHVANETATEIEHPEELINAMLSPRHMAARWRDYLFAINGGGDLRFKTGTVNYKAAFGLNFNGGAYLQDFSLSAIQHEDEDIIEYRTLFDAETIEFEYPLTLAQYNAIKSNPYGKVSVNGYVGWIQEFSYTLATGLASFKLIATH